LDWFLRTRQENCFDEFITQIKLRKNFRRLLQLRVTTNSEATNKTQLSGLSHVCMSLAFAHPNQICSMANATNIDSHTLQNVYNSLLRFSPQPTSLLTCDLFSSFLPLDKDDAASIFQMFYCFEANNLPQDSPNHYCLPYATFTNLIIEAHKPEHVSKPPLWALYPFLQKDSGTTVPAATSANSAAASDLENELNQLLGIEATPKLYLSKRSLKRLLKLQYSIFSHSQTQQSHLLCDYLENWATQIFSTATTFANDPLLIQRVSMPDTETILLDTFLSWQNVQAPFFFRPLFWLLQNCWTSKSSMVELIKESSKVGIGKQSAIPSGLHHCCLLPEYCMPNLQDVSKHGAKDQSENGAVPSLLNPLLIFELSWVLDEAIKTPSQNTQSSLGNLNQDDQSHRNNWYLLYSATAHGFALVS
jgi:hypothetical protein